MNNFKNTEDIQNILPVYFRSWWLDIVYGKGQWNYLIETNSDGYIIALLPYVIQRKYFLKKITMGKESHYGGPFLMKSKVRKTDSQIHYENQILKNLLSKLPDLGFIYFQLMPQIASHLEFLWQNYSIKINYTYHIDLKDNISDLFAKLKGSNRTIIKKNQKEGFRVEISDNTELFLYTLLQSFQSKNKNIPYNIPKLRDIVNETLRQNSGIILLVYDGNNEVLATGFFIFDHETMYYYTGTNNVGINSPSALVFCIWEAIKIAKDKGLMLFDFEGSDIKGIEHFFRSFGGNLVPIYRVFKAKNLFIRIVALFQNQKLFY